MRDYRIRPLPRVVTRKRSLQRAKPYMDLGDQELTDLDRSGYPDGIEPWNRFAFA